MATCSELQTMLAEAEAAYHSMQMGSRVVTLSQGQKSITYNQASVSGLLRYIADLRRQVAACTGVPDPTARRVVRFVPS